MRCGIFSSFTFFKNIKSASLHLVFQIETVANVFNLGPTYFRTVETPLLTFKVLRIATMKQMDIRSTLMITAAAVDHLFYWINFKIAIVAMFTHTTELKILLSLRPLSLVSRCHGLSVIANAILKQMWFLTNTLLVCLAFWLIFAIMGVQLFGGKFDSVSVESTFSYSPSSTKHCSVSSVSTVMVWG